MAGAWLWKDGRLTPLEPWPDIEFEEMNLEYEKRGYVRTFHIEFCADVWVREDVPPHDPGPMAPYRYVVWLELGAVTENIFIEELPDWITFQPFLAAHTRLFETTVHAIEQERGSLGEIEAQSKAGQHTAD